MGYFVGLTNLRPAARQGGVKWTSAGIYEGASAAGPWTEIDAQALPGYADAAAPPVFALDTTAATAPSGLWYKAQFRDDFAGVQDSVPEYNGASGAPDVEWVRETSKADFSELGYEAPDPGEADGLQVKLDEAVFQFWAITGVDARAIPDDDKRVVLTRMAIRMLTEYLAASGQMEQLETAADYDMLSAMSASDYSETRRGVVRPNPQVLHPWPALNRLLWSVINDFGQGSAEDGPMVGDPLSPERVARDLREAAPLGPRYPRYVPSGWAVWPWPPL